MNNYRDLITGYNELLNEVRSDFSELSDEEFYKQEAPGSWTPLQVLEHLNITANGYLKSIREKFVDVDNLPKSKITEINFTLMGRILKSFGPEGKIRIKAPVVLRPVSDNPDKVKTIEEYFSIQNEIIELLKICEEKEVNVNKVKIPSPVSSIVKVKLGEFFVFTLGHQRRHVKQIKRILNSSN